MLDVLVLRHKMFILMQVCGIIGEKELNSREMERFHQTGVGRVRAH